MAILRDLVANTFWLKPCTMISIGAASLRFLTTAEMTRYYMTILTSPAI
jgi:hypothetical protein